MLLQSLTKNLIIDSFTYVVKYICHNMDMTFSVSYSYFEMTNLKRFVEFALAKISFYFNWYNYHGLVYHIAGMFGQGKFGEFGK